NCERALAFVFLPQGCIIFSLFGFKVKVTILALKIRRQQVLVFLGLLCCVSVVLAQGPVLLTADGQTDTYTLISNKLGAGPETQIAAILPSVHILRRHLTVLWGGMFLSSISTSRPIMTAAWP